jgi:hypothetical protein
MLSITKYWSVDELTNHPVILYVEDSPRWGFGILKDFELVHGNKY